MAGRAAVLEIRLARCRITDDDGLRPLAGVVVAVHAEAMQERGNVADLCGRERELRHALIGTSVQDDGTDQLAVLIVEDDRGAQQARPTVAPARVAAMAERAVGAVHASPALERGGIGWRSGRIGADRAADSARRRAGTAP